MLIWDCIYSGGRKPLSAPSVIYYIAFLKFIFKPLSMCKGVWQRGEYVHVCTLKVKMRATDSLQLELQVVVSCLMWLLGTERGIPL